MMNFPEKDVSQFKPNFASAEELQHLVLWDGQCGFCRRWVVWVRRQDRFHRLDFCPYQEADLTAEMRENCSQALHVFTREGEMLRGGRAALFCGRFTRYRHLARVLDWPVFLPLVEFAYGIVAQNRLFFSKFLFTDRSK